MSTSVWLDARRKAWLRDHPGKAPDDYDYAGSYGDTEEGQQAFAKWHFEWMAREGAVLRRRRIGSQEEAAS